MRATSILSIFLLCLYSQVLLGQEKTHLTPDDPAIHRIDALNNHHNRQSLAVLDSLGEVYQNPSAPELALLLEKRAQFYERIYVLDSAILYFSEAVLLHPKISDKRGLKTLGLCYNGLGHCYWKSGDNQKGLDYYRKSNEVYEEIGFEQGLAYNYQDMGLIYRERGEFVEAIRHYKLSMHYAKKVDDKMGLAINLKNMGNIKKKLGLGREALENFIEATAVFEADSSMVKQRYYFTFLGEKALLYQELNEYEQAEKNYLKALKLAKERNDQYWHATILRNLGSMYLKQDKLEQAADCFNQVREQLENGQYKMSTIFLFKKLSNYHNMLHHQDSAMFFMDKAVVLAEGADSKEHLMEVYREKMYLLGEYKYWDKAIALGLKVLKYEEEHHELGQMADTERNLAKFYQEGKKDYKKATEYYGRYAIHRDSLDKVNEANDLIKAEIKAEYQIEKNNIEQENQREQLMLKNEIEQEKLMKTTALIVLLMLTAGFVVVWRYYQQKKRANELIAAQKEELQVQHEQLEELLNFKENMTSMIVHDLKNPLSTIINVSRKKEADLVRIQQEGKRMLNLVMNILDVRKFEEATMLLKKEIYSLNSLLEEAKVQVKLLQKDKSIAMHLPAMRLQVEVDVYMMERVFVNLLTNAIKYSPLGGSIHIRCEQVEENWVKLSFVDEGVGIPKEVQQQVFEPYLQGVGEKVNSSTGLGLSYCKYTVEAHGGEIGIVSEEGKGTEVYLTLPLVEIQKGEVGLQQEDNLLPINEEEQAVLAPIRKQLKQVTATEYSEVATILKQLDKEILSEQMLAWMEAIETASLTGDQQRYEQLIS
ncbi:tetratricopeptide repeat-containing sensor histidine kinase [Limibacter armeniacum]|uniref:tetratricopeptide repeat-containing sensor histidine kinase n=1 Tax=Limibacter armeniacum TaxID=466084 RepID=UPI002FE59238